MTTFYPALKYRDAAAAIDFLERAFGFARHVVVPGEGGAVAHAELRLDDAYVMLGSAGAGLEWEPGHGSAYAAVDDVDALYGRAREAGAAIERELADTEYGSREFTARDPEGNLWSFGTYRPGA
jgi:uncharacterized glyoxalase superfamily protein PhnB